MFFDFLQVKGAFELSPAVREHPLFEKLRVDFKTIFYVQKTQMRMKI